MSAYAWNEETYDLDIFVIMIFFDASKKRINPSAKEYENVFKFLNDRDPERIGGYY